MDGLTTFFSSIRWQDVADIGLNSYILFRLYVLFRGTNAFRVLIGIGFLWIFQRIAVSLGLILTSWAIQGITAVVALIIIIVFRNEIRSVLQAKNWRTILWGFPRRGRMSPTEIIVESVFELARKRIGALLILPGREDLSEVVQYGVVWNGTVSKEMLVSIFWHGNPVHDGAAIVDEDQITHVSVILPLSRRKDLPSRYGTRHRAAAGLAEKTDALVIAISEESGTVAVANGNRVTTVFNRTTLTKILKMHAGRPSEGESLQRRENIELGVAALVSILFVITMWFSFSRGMESLVTIEVPIEYRNRAPGMEIRSASSNIATLELAGAGALIKSIGPDQVKVLFDLNNAGAGENRFTISRENISLPPGVVLKQIVPETLVVTLDATVKKTLPVQLDWKGTLPSHIIIESVTISPETVQVIGAQGILEDISTIYTEKILLDDITESGSMTVNLLLSPAALKITSESKDKISLDYVVRNRHPGE